MNYVPMSSSKSTDKLAIICETIEQKILSDSVLKERVSKISLTWSELRIQDYCMPMPFLEITFK